MNSPWKDKRFSEESLQHIDDRFLPGTHQEVDFLEQILEVKPGARILDLGCGAGRHSIEFASRGYVVVGVDISPWLLRVARQRASRAGVEVTFLQGSIANLDELLMAEPPFDGAISICESGLGVLGGWREDLAFLRSVREKLKEGSKFVLTTFNGLRRYRMWKKGDDRFDFIEGVQRWQTPPDWNGKPLKEKIRLYIPSEIRIIFEIAGFRDVKIYGCAPGQFHGQPLRIDDIEMMAVGTA
jgi:cyclopropane fatty-acyl-phospholipid synthase-like methyltransferase